MLNDPILSCLEAELEPWPRLLVIADRLEELGEDRLAWAYRWLAEYHKWPSRHGSLWVWPGWGDDDQEEISGYLPSPVSSWLKARPGTVGRHWNQFDSLALALRAAAEAVATTLYFEENPVETAR